MVNDDVDELFKKISSIKGENYKICKNCKFYSNETKKCSEMSMDTDENNKCLYFEESPDYIYKQEKELEYLEIMKHPDIFNKITENEIDKQVVGEIDTRKVIFLCGCGRLVINHQIASFNLLVNDEAGCGKDYVTKKTLEMIPKDCYIHKTRISPTVFTYWHNPKYEPEWTWDGKIFYPEDISENVLNSDVFKVMSSNGSSATIVIKQRAIDIDIKGKPVMITTTATATPNPELTRRFVILNLNSSTDQTMEIMKRHSEYKQAGIVPDYDEKLINAQSLLKRVKVKIPFAEAIYKHFPINNLIMRTHYPRFLDWISASAAFHQFQRKSDEEGFILAEKQDYEIARECFLKLCSNKYMIPLTINQKKILELFEINQCLKGSATTLHSSCMAFLSLPALQTNLGILVKYGILHVWAEKDNWNRDIEVYGLSPSYKPNDKLEIPKFDKLELNEHLKAGTLGIKGVNAEKGNTFENCINNKVSLVSNLTIIPLTPLIPNNEIQEKLQ